MKRKIILIKIRIILMKRKIILIIVSDRGNLWRRTVRGSRTGGVTVVIIYIIVFIVIIIVVVFVSTTPVAVPLLWR